MIQIIEPLKGKRLAVIGGSYLQLPLILKAKELGVITYCFSWLDGAVCKDYCDHFYPISILEKELILDECRKADIDGVTTIASDAAVPTVNFVASELSLVGNPDANSEQYVNKYSMRVALMDAGIEVPKFVQLSPENFDSALEIVERADLSLPIIIKPVDRSGSRGVVKLDDCSQLEEMVLRAAQESFSKNVIVEEFIEGKEFSVESISWEGGHYLLAITEKETTGPPFFVELAHHQPAALTEEEYLRFKEFTFASLNALKVIYGASHTEIKITDEGKVYLIETGARMGGDFIGSDLVQLSTGYDFVKGVIEVALGQFSEPSLTIKLCSGVYFLSKEREFLLDIINEPQRFEVIIKTELLNEQLKPITNSSDRSGYLIYQAAQKFIPQA